jgi:acyl-CoA synthetase (AMP-forming)/AMP-acid ligase II
MANASTPTDTPPETRQNVTDRLRHVAATMPNAIAVASPRRSLLSSSKMHRGSSGAAYTTITFAELDAQATRLARGLATWGVPPATRLALLVRPGIEFVALVFALLRAGMVTILVDPGLGRRNLVRCLADAEPEGFIAISVAQAARTVLRRRFPQARWNVTVGRRWFWGGITLNQLRIADCGLRIAGVNPQSEIRNPKFVATHPDDPAAIIFTSGSTGPPKGVLYTHRMFDTQVSEIQSMYNIEPGGVDLACFPLFALFNSAMGVTTVMPDMDFSLPARANPKKLLAAANDWQATQAFASPAVWRVIGDYCAKTGDRIPTLRQVFSCGAPVGADLLRKTLACVAPGAKMHTPYGATECLPVSTIEAAEFLGETAEKTNLGAGVCVGRKFDSIEWRVIRITDEPIETIKDAEELPTGEIGELMVRGPQVSPRYVTGTGANKSSKIASSNTQYAVLRTPASERVIGNGQSCAFGTWHRTGDVGYFDELGRFWYCGRKSQRVKTRNGPLFTEKIEAVFNSLPGVRRSALVGVRPYGFEEPVVIVEPESPGIIGNGSEHECRQDELINGWYDMEPLLEKLWYADHGFTPLKAILFHPSLPVDVRHNAKINREALAIWAYEQLRHNISRPQPPAPGS